MKRFLAILLTLVMLCSVTSVSLADGYDFAATIDWAEEQYDVIVIGLGLAGATAGITAADQGAKVLITEKAPEGQEGGNSRYAGQVIITPLETSHDEFISYYTALAMTIPMPLLRLCWKHISRKPARTWNG